LQWTSGYAQHCGSCTSCAGFKMFFSIPNHPGILYLPTVSHTNPNQKHVTTCDITTPLVCRSSSCQQHTLAAHLAYVPLCTVLLHYAVNWVRGCAEEQPVVTLIPGSVEQRGQVFRTSHGDPPFCRCLFTLPLPQVQTP